MTDLLNCPFCGSDKIALRRDDDICWYACAPCGATGPTIHKRADEDAPEWNTRTPPPGGDTRLSGEVEGQSDDLREMLSWLDVQIERKRAFVAGLDGCDTGLDMLNLANKYERLAALLRQLAAERDGALAKLNGTIAGREFHVDNAAELLASLQASEAERDRLKQAVREIDAMPRYVEPIPPEYVSSLVKRFNRALDLCEAALSESNS